MNNNRLNQTRVVHRNVLPDNKTAWECFSPALKDLALKLGVTSEIVNNGFCLQDKKLFKNILTSGNRHSVILLFAIVFNKALLDNQPTLKLKEVLALEARHKAYSIELVKALETEFAIYANNINTQTAQVDDKGKVISRTGRMIIGGLCERLHKEYHSYGARPDQLLKGIDLVDMIYHSTLSLCKQQERDTKVFDEITHQHFYEEGIRRIFIQASNLYFDLTFGIADDFKEEFKEILKEFPED